MSWVHTINGHHVDLNPKKLKGSGTVSGTYSVDNNGAKTIEPTGLGFLNDELYSIGFEADGIGAVTLVFSWTSKPELISYTFNSPSGKAHGLKAQVAHQNDLVESEPGDITFRALVGGLPATRHVDATVKDLVFQLGGKTLKIFKTDMDIKG